MFGIMLTLHVLGATIWAGGHLVLSLSVLPRALRRRDPAVLREFEAGYERIGMPALAVQILTGLWLGYRLVPRVGEWFTLGSAPASQIGVKLLLLVLTLALAVHARVRLVPRLTPERLGFMAVHVVAVTALAVLMVIVGTAFRTGAWLP